MARGGKFNRPVAYFAPRAVVEAGRRAEATTEAERKSKQKAAAARRAKQHKQMVKGIAAEIEARYPCIPAGEADEIADHAFEVGSGRVGRTSALDLDEKIDLAVIAHIRHCHTEYDELLWNPGGSLFGDNDLRAWARDQVKPEIDRILREWRGENGEVLTGCSTPAAGAGEATSEAHDPALDS
jgi:hypothetical protein